MMNPCQYYVQKLGSQIDNMSYIVNICQELNSKMSYLLYFRHTFFISKDLSSKAVVQSLHLSAFKTLPKHRLPTQSTVENHLRKEVRSSGC